jgi:hypothetical protein
MTVALISQCKVCHSAECHLTECCCAELDEAWNGFGKPIRVGCLDHLQRKSRLTFFHDVSCLPRLGATTIAQT